MRGFPLRTNGSFTTRAGTVWSWISTQHSSPMSGATRAKAMDRHRVGANPPEVTAPTGSVPLNTV